MGCLPAISRLRRQAILALGGAENAQHCGAVETGCIRIQPWGCYFGMQEERETLARQPHRTRRQVGRLLALDGRVQMRVFVIGSLFSCNNLKTSPSRELFQKSCQEIGRALSVAGHEIILCSPFDDSADVHVLRGAISAKKENTTRISFHFIDNHEVTKKLDSAIENLNPDKVTKIPHPPPINSTQESLRYAWLLCQLNAMESSHVTIALGGAK